MCLTRGRSRIKLRTGPPSELSRLKTFIRSSQPHSGMLTESDNLWKIERRSDGAVVVRVPSPSAGDRAIPEAVFAFRQGDPQFIYWDERLRNQENGQ